MLYLLGLGTICLAWQLPGHYFPWTGFQQEALAACGAALVALAVVVPLRAGTLKVPVPASLALLLALVPPAQWAAGMIPYRSDALLAMAYLAGFGLTVIAARQLASSDRRFVPTLFGAVTVGALVSLAIGMVQWLQWGPFTFIHALVPGDRVYANFMQPNHLAALLGLGLPGVVWAYETRRAPPLVAGFGVAALTLGLVMTQSRVGWLLAGALTLLWFVFRKRLGSRVGASAVVGWLMCYVGGVAAWSGLTKALIGSAATSLAERAHSGSRWLHWQTMWDAALRSPWVGYGWGQVSAAQQAATLDHPATFEWLGYSHNLVLDLLIWNGLPLGLTVISVMVVWMVRRIGNCANFDAWALVAALVMLVGFAMVEYPQAYTYFVLPAGLMVGALDARAPKEGEATTGWLSRNVFTIVAAAVAALSFAIGKEYLRIEDAVRDVRFRDAGYTQHAAVPDVVLLDGPREYVRLWVTKNDDGDPDTDIAWLRDVSQRFASPPALLRYAVATGARGEAAVSAHTLQILCHISLPRYCDEGRAYWEKSRRRIPALARVSFPPTPPQ